MIDAELYATGYLNEMVPTWVPTSSLNDKRRHLFFTADDLAADQPLSLNMPLYLGQTTNLTQIALTVRGIFTGMVEILE